MSDWKVALNQLRGLAERLGPTAKGWHISTWSPGDGWTRYRLASDGHDLSANYTRKEFEAFIAGMVALEHAQWQATRTEVPTP